MGQEQEYRSTKITRIKTTGDRKEKCRSLTHSFFRGGLLQMTSHGPLSEQSSNAGGGVHSRPLLIIPLRQGVEAWGASSDASSEGGGSFHSACSGPLSERVPSLSGRSVHGARVSPHGRVSPDSRGSPRASGSPLARGSPHRGASPRGVVSPCVAVSPSSGAVVSPSSNGGSPRSAGSAARRTRELEVRGGNRVGWVKHRPLTKYPSTRYPDRCRGRPK